METTKPTAKYQFETLLGHELFDHPMFYELLLRMAELHSQKNHDYSGPGTFLLDLKAAARVGVDPFVNVCLRIQQKMSRLEAFINSGHTMVPDEKIEDTLIDHANYSLLAIVLRCEGKPQEVPDAKS